MLKEHHKDILLVTSEFPPLPGGIGNHAFNLARHLSKHGNDIEVITDQRTKHVEEVQFDAEAIFKIIRIQIRSPRIFMYFNRLLVLFKKIKIRSTVIASGKFSLWSVALASLFFKRNYIAVIHGTEVNFKNKLLKFFIDKALLRFNKVIAVSHYTKDLVSYLKLKNIVVIPNGLDLSEWEVSAPSKLQLKGNPKLITVGNVTERKGQLQVIKHMPELIKHFPELHYHCVGNPTQKEAFLMTASQLGVEHHISFYGRMAHNELEAYLKAADVFVMLSGKTPSGDVEGFGIAILEANHLGLPAIGAIGCGIEDAINNGNSGVLIDRTDSKAFLKAITTVLDQKEQFSKRAQSWAKQHSWEKIIKHYIKVISQ